MRTIDRKTFRAPALCLAGLIFLAAFSLPGSAATPSRDGQRFFIAAAAGIFYPGQDAVRQVYEKPAWPVELQLGWEVNPRLFLFGAARYLRLSGNTFPLPSVQPAETYAVRLEILALRLGLNYFLGRGRITPFFGAGLQVDFIRETWRDLPIAAREQKAGFFAQAGGRCRIGRSRYLLAQLDYSFIPASAVNGSGQRLNLGGPGLMLGLAIGVF